MLKEWVKDDHITLVANDAYWGTAPAIKTIIFRPIPETSTAISELKSGGVDVITNVPPEQMDGLNTDTTKVVAKATDRLFYINVNTLEEGPLQNKLVRQAIAYAIDVDAINESLLGGMAQRTAINLPLEAFGYDASLTPYEYNPEKARQLVSESSYNGEVLEYELKSGYYTFGNEAAEAIVAMWKEIGVNAQIVFRDTKEYNNVSNWSNTMRFPDPSAGLWLLWGPGSTPAENTWLDMPQEFIDAGKEMSSIIDPVRRKALSKKLMTIWREEAPGALLYYPYESWGIRDGLEWTPYSSQAMDFRAGNFKLAK